MAVKHVAALLRAGLGSGEGHRQAVAAQDGWVRWTSSDVEVIAMDEFAIQKGHRYATVIVDA